MSGLICGKNSDRVRACNPQRGPEKGDRAEPGLGGVRGPGCSGSETVSPRPWVPAGRNPPPDAPQRPGVQGPRRPRRDRTTSQAHPRLRWIGNQESVNTCVLVSVCEFLPSCSRAVLRAGPTSSRQDAHHKPSGGGAGARRAEESELNEEPRGDETLAKASRPPQGLEEPVPRPETPTFRPTPHPAALRPATENMHRPRLLHALLFSRPPPIPL